MNVVLILRKRGRLSFTMTEQKVFPPLAGAGQTERCGVESEWFSGWFFGVNGWVPISPVGCWIKWAKEFINGGVIKPGIVGQILTSQMIQNTPDHFWSFPKWHPSYTGTDPLRKI